MAAASIPNLPPSIALSNAQSLNQSIIPLSTSNLTTLNEPVDPFFGFIPFFKGPKLNENSALLNSVDVALQLALSNWKGYLGTATFILESHPEVRITIAPRKGAHSLSIKYAVWGLNIGIDLMIRTGNFQSATFLLTDGGTDMGTVEFSVVGSYSAGSDDVDTMQSVTDRSSTTSTPSNGTVWLEQNVSNNTTSTLDGVDGRQDSQLRVGFYLSGSVLTKYDIFYAALDALRGLSSYQKTALVLDSDTPLLNAGVDLITKDLDDPPSIGKVPQLQAQWVVRALAQMPEFMLGRGTFMEVSMEIAVDGTPVGWVLLKRREFSGGVAKT